MLKALADAIAETLPPPCETEKCKHQARCATEELACKAFASYVYGRSKKQKQPRAPSKKLYEKIFSVKAHNFDEASTL